MAPDTISQSMDSGFPTTAIVLAGGLGIRLRSVVADRPKTLAPAAGKPFLSYVLRYLAHQNIQNVVLSVSYLAGQVRDFAGDGQKWGLKITYSEEQSPLGTGGALRQASQGFSGPFFALNGDTLFLANLEELWRVHRSSGALATLALLRREDGSRRGCVRLENDRIVAFTEKPAGVSTTLINAGLYILTPPALASIQPGQKASIEQEIFPRLAANGQLAGQIQEGYFIDIGTPESLAAFEKVVQAGSLADLLD